MFILFYFYLHINTVKIYLGPVLSFCCVSRAYTLSCYTSRKAKAFPLALVAQRPTGAGISGAGLVGQAV